MINPQLDGRSQPLTFCIGSQAFWNWITVEDKTIEHKRKVDVSDAPLTKEVVGVSGEQRFCGGEKLLGGDLSLRREWRSCWTVEHDLGGALLPNGH